jgi:hypothetical protein
MSMPTPISARTIIEAHAHGQLSLTDAERALGRVVWAKVGRYTEAQLAGVEDTPPPDSNSPDWIQLVPGVSPAARTAFTRIYDNRRR